jgi:hypothetical protein
MPPHPTSWRFILILSSYQHWVFQVVSFCQVSSPNVCICPAPPCKPHAPPIPFLVWSPEQYLVRHTDHRTLIIPTREKLSSIWYKWLISCPSSSWLYFYCILCVFGVVKDMHPSEILNCSNRISCSSVMTVTAATTCIACLHHFLHLQKAPGAADFALWSFTRSKVKCGFRIVPWCAAPQDIGPIGLIGNTVLK